MPLYLLFMADMLSSTYYFGSSWYVGPDCRRKRAGAALMAAAEEWARSRGCKEMGSDPEVINLRSAEAHRRLGYIECNRLVHFGKDL